MSDDIKNEDYRVGPTVTAVYSCDGCRWLTVTDGEMSSLCSSPSVITKYGAAQNNSGRYSTPAWCPYRKGDDR